MATTATASARCAIEAKTMRIRARATRGTTTRGGVAARVGRRRAMTLETTIRTTTTTMTTTTTTTTMRGARGRDATHVARASSGGDDGEKAPFGYTRADVMLIGGGVTGAGFAAYYGLQSFGGMDATKAGNAVQLTFVLGLTLVWIASYVLRVFNKDMTYVKQLKDYEDAVMQKRLEEMPAGELEKMMDDLDQK